MSEDKQETDGTQTVNLAQALERDGNAAVFPDPNPADDDADMDPDPFTDEDADDDGVPVSQLDTQDKPDETDKPDKSGKPAGWNKKRQERDEARAARDAARDEQVAELKGQVGAVTEMIEKMSTGNQALLSKLVERASGAKGGDDKLPETADGLATAISELDPERAEFADFIPALNNIVKAINDAKGQRAVLQKALSDQDKRTKEERTALAERADKRDARDADSAAQRSVAEHLDGVMRTKFKGKDAMRKEVETRAQSILADSGFGKDERVTVRVANMALDAAAERLAAELAAKSRGKKPVPPQDDFTSAAFADDITGQGNQTTEEAMKSMAGRL